MSPEGNSQPKEKPEPQPAAATIETIVDGHDVGQVNLWPGPTDRSRPVARCYRGDKVKVLDRSGEYVQVETSSGVKGWCADGFVRVR